MTKSYLELVTIKKVYEKKYVACENINISIDKGKFATILGPSGCGKSTILKMIAGFEKPTTGKILVNGVDIKDVPIHKRQTATFFQDYALFPNMTAYQNITYGIKLLRKKLDNIPNKVIKNRNKIYSNALKFAAKKINFLHLAQLKIEKEIMRLNKFYLNHDFLLKIKDMRYVKFQQQILILEKKIKKFSNNNEYHGFKLSRKNKRKIFWNQFLSFFGVHKYIQFDATKINNHYELQILELIKFYLYKKQNDNKIDHLWKKYWDIDEWISYWQNYPQLTIEEFDKFNTTRLLTKNEIKKEAQKVIDLVGLTNNENKYPHELSGGMQQRVALARAIIVKPDILLLDEPLSALDAKVKQKMQEELKRIHNELKINFILVTHDQEEALSLSDLVIVMSKGKIQQIGTPKNIYEHPKNEWVANFIGCANFLNAKYIGKNKILLENKEFNISSIKNQTNKFLIDIDFKLMIRPENIKPCSPKKAMLIVKILSNTYKGTNFTIKCITKNKTIIQFQSLNQFKVNDIIGIEWNFVDTTILLNNKKSKYVNN